MTSSDDDDWQHLDHSDSRHTHIEFVLLGIVIGMVLTWILVVLT
jgi:hypothetical protein